MKVSIGLNFRDKDYQTALGNALGKDFVIRLNSNEADVILTDIDKGTGNEVFLDGDMRFSGVDQIKDMIVNRYTESYGRYEPALAFGSCQNISVSSSAGGSGTSEIAINLARNYQMSGLKTIYLTLDSIPYRVDYECEGNVNELIYMMEQKGDIGAYINEYVSYDSYGLTHINYADKFNCLAQINTVLLEKFLWNLSKCFECIVFDTGSLVTPQSLTAINTADSLVVVNTRNSKKKDRFRQIIERASDVEVLNMAYDYECEEDICIAMLEGDELDFDNEMGIRTYEIMEKLDECERSS